MLHKNIKILTWFNFFTDFILYAPIAIIYFERITGSYALGMSIFSITMVSSALFEIPTGIFSDYIGRRKTLIYGALFSVIYSLFYAIGNSFFILAIGALFQGLSRSFYSGNNDALLHSSLAESHQENEYEEYLGRLSAMFQISAAIVAVIGSVLATWSFSLIMWLSVIPQIICLILSFYIVEPKIQEKGEGNLYFHLHEALKQFLHNKKLRLLSISSIVGYGIGEASYQFRSAFIATLWPLWAIGIVRFLSSIGAWISFHYSGRILKKFNSFNVLFFGSIYSQVINIFSLLFPTIFSPILMSSTSLLFGVETVAENSLMQKEFQDKQRATMSSLNSLLGNLFFGVAATFLGYVADILSPGKALLLSQLLVIPIIWIYWKLFKNYKTA